MQRVGGLPTTGLTDLQRLTLTRIVELEHGIYEHYGIAPRCGIEWEFLSTDKNGHHILSVDPSLDRVNKQGAFKGGFAESPYIERVYKELRTQRSLYEVVIGKGQSDSRMRRGCFPQLPSEMAWAAWNARRLIETGAPAHGFQRAAFIAAPQSPEFAAGMHVNISLWDVKSHPSRPLFQSEGGEKCVTNTLLDHCVKSLLHIQKEGMILHLPSLHSYSRIAHSPNTPRKIMCGRYKEDGASLLIRDAHDRGKTRIENRLAGADADPFLLTLITLGAMVKALKENVKPLQEQGHEDESLTIGDHVFSIKPFHGPYGIQRPIKYHYNTNATHSKARKALTNSDDIKDIMGKELFSAYCRASKPEQASLAR